MHEAQDAVLMSRVSLQSQYLVSRKPFCPRPYVTRKGPASVLFPFRLGGSCIMACDRNFNTTQLENHPFSARVRGCQSYHF